MAASVQITFLCAARQREGEIVEVLAAQPRESLSSGEAA